MSEQTNEKMSEETSEKTTIPRLVTNSKNLSEEMPLTDSFTIGRLSHNNLPIYDDTKVAPRHARIEKKPHGFVIRDLLSQTGTLVNGTRIIEAPLKHGDQIQVGEYTFSFYTQDPPKCHISSHNIKWQKQLDALPHLAGNDFSVLLLGPSGTGKDVLANEIHRLSPRKPGPFISVNCCALSESLIESELFGHIKGSFTGAINDRKGAFEVARCGTLFLDEIGDLSAGLQAKLLRALENQEIKPVGSDKAIKTDVRVIAATHQNLQKKIKDGSFRSDLYYRLAVLQMSPPSLLERMEDFEPLAFQFCKEQRICLSYDAIEELKKHTWPGNIRELKNTILRASALHRGKRVQKEEIAALIDNSMDSENDSLIRQDYDANESMPIIKQMEKNIILKFLKANRGNQRQTAIALGLPKSTLNDRIKVYQIDMKSLFPSAVIV